MTTSDERAAYIRALVEAAPPMTDEQRDRIRALFRGPVGTADPAKSDAA